jgi:hypothetical protein
MCRFHLTNYGCKKLKEEQGIIFKIHFLEERVVFVVGLQVFDKIIMMESENG